MKTPLALLFLSTVILTPAGAWAVSPADLQARLDAGEHVTVVDVRPAALYKNGHISGAINIPASLVPLKGLPQLGRVVVCDDGLGPDTATAAAAALNQKPGITAEVLAGGFAAWENNLGKSTKSAGMQPEELPVITYDRLKAAQGPDVTLVDLRKPSPAAESATSGRQAKEAVSLLSDLSAEFPKSRVTTSPFDGAAQRAKSSESAPPLLVLIDNGDGSAQAMARTLKANGIKRFAILAGGEEIIARKGQPGLQRSSTTIMTIPGQAIASPTN